MGVCMCTEVARDLELAACLRVLMQVTCPEGEFDCYEEAPEVSGPLPSLLGSARREAGAPLGLKACQVVVPKASRPSWVFNASPGACQRPLGGRPGGSKEVKPATGGAPSH